MTSKSQVTKLSKQPTRKLRWEYNSARKYKYQMTHSFE